MGCRIRTGCVRLPVAVQIFEERFSARKVWDALPTLEIMRTPSADLTRSEGLRHLRRRRRRDGCCFVAEADGLTFDRVETTTPKRTAPRRASE